MALSPAQFAENAPLHLAQQIGSGRHHSGGGGGVLGHILERGAAEHRAALTAHVGMTLQSHAHGLALNRMEAEHGYRTVEAAQAHGHRLAEGRSAAENQVKVIHATAAADVTRSKEAGHQERLSHGYIRRTDARYTESPAPHESGSMPEAEAHVGPEPTRPTAPSRTTHPLVGPSETGAVATPETRVTKTALSKAMSKGRKKPAVKGTTPKFAYGE